MKRIFVVLLLLLIMSCAFWSKSPEAEATVLRWEQEELYIEGYGTLMGLVEVHYLVENTGEVDIDFYDVFLSVKAVTADMDTNTYTSESAGAFLEVGSLRETSTFMDVASNRAVSAEILDIQVRTY